MRHRGERFSNMVKEMTMEGPDAVWYTSKYKVSPSFYFVMKSCTCFESRSRSTRPISLTFGRR